MIFLKIQNKHLNDKIDFFNKKKIKDLTTRYIPISVTYDFHCICRHM